MDQTGEFYHFRSRIELMRNFTHHTPYNFSLDEVRRILIEFKSTWITIQKPTTIVLLGLYIPVFLLAFLGNSLVILVVIKNPHMRKVKNLFLVNLAVADMAVTVICMPLAVGTTIYRLWVYSEVMCKITAYMQGVAVASSIFTLAALSFDRLLAIKSPTNLRQLITKCQATKVIVSVWILSSMFMGPILFVRTVQSVKIPPFQILSFCIEKWPQGVDKQAYSLFLLIAVYIIPCCTVAVCYCLIGRTLCSNELHRKTSDNSSTVMLGRKRVARMLIVLIAMFLMCWLPYNITSISLDLKSDNNELLILPFCLWLGHAHSAINPLIYWFLNKSFRHCMRKVLRCHPGISRHRKDSPSPHSGGADIADILKLDLPTGGGQGDENRRSYPPRRTCVSTRCEGSLYYNRRYYYHRHYVPHANVRENPQRRHFTRREISESEDEPQTQTADVKETQMETCDSLTVSVDLHNTQEVQDCTQTIPVSHSPGAMEVML